MRVTRWMRELKDDVKYATSAEGRAGLHGGRRHHPRARHRRQQRDVRARRRLPLRPLLS